jgi:DNA-directed RNA polymerase specialized sigma24 family protein
MTTWDDEALLTSAVSSSDAFAVFYDRSLPKVIAYFRRRVAEPEQAFDLAAEAFARVLASVDRFDADRGLAMAWVLRIAAACSSMPNAGAPSTTGPEQCLVSAGCS